MGGYASHTTAKNKTHKKLSYETGNNCQNHTVDKILHVLYVICILEVKCNFHPEKKLFVFSSRQLLRVTLPFDPFVLCTSF